ncbi:hypothetical protein [Celerinatantimonas sp. MCCC 1A17872]|uniref:hypothetical protein n=1 Tax=Celerinatantimonas sp. MCCC 1A17872 TaxID=3177514 RepID=UPI0038C2F6D9
MTIETYNYDQPISGDGPIEHVDITIAEGESVAQYAPLVLDAELGQYKVALATDTAAQFLASFAVDASAGAVVHHAIKSITIDPDFVAWPDEMTDIVKAGLFAGTPIATQSPRAR